MSAAQIALVAQAEKILNRSLAYQAAAVVHELRDQLDLNVGELRLIVTPESSAAPGCCRVICTIVSLAGEQAPERHASASTRSVGSAHTAGE